MSIGLGSRARKHPCNERNNPIQYGMPFKRDLGGPLARKSYEMGETAALPGLGPKLKLVRKKRLVSGHIREVRLMMVDGRITPKLKIGKGRYPIEPATVIKIMGELINKLENRVIPHCHVNRTMELCVYIMKIMAINKRKKCRRFDLVFSKSSWDFLRDQFLRNTV
jgi:hypothetical protein